MKLKFDFAHYFSRESSPQKPPKNPEITVPLQFFRLLNSSNRISSKTQQQMIKSPCFCSGCTNS